MPYNENRRSSESGAQNTEELTEKDKMLIKELIVKLRADGIIQERDEAEIEPKVSSVKVGDIVPLMVRGKELKSKWDEKVYVSRSWNASKNEPGEIELIYGSRTIDYSKESEYHRLTQIPAERVAKGIE